MLRHTSGEVWRSRCWLSPSAARGCSVRREPSRGAPGAAEETAGGAAEGSERRRNGAADKGSWGCGTGNGERLPERAARRESGAVQPYPWRCRSCLASPAPRSRRRELRTRRSSASKLSTTGLPRATGPKKAACGAWGPAGGPAGTGGPEGAGVPAVSAMLGPARARTRRCLWATAGAEPRWTGREVPLGYLFTACFISDGTGHVLIVPTAWQP